MTFTRSFLLAASLSLVAGIAAAPADAQEIKGKTYHFGTHPARTAITFVSEADLETIHGVTNKIAGNLRVDASGKKASGRLRVGVSTLKTGIALRDEHLRSAQWLDVKKYPAIELQLIEAKPAANGKTWSYTANLTIKGVTKKINGTARVRAYDDKIAKALGPGSWIRVRTKFKVTLSDCGIRIPQVVGAKVSKTWDIGVDIYGTTAIPQKSR